MNNKQIDSLYDSFIVNTTSGDTRAVCKLASVKTRQIHRKYQVCFQVVDGNYVPLLSRETCEKMHLIQRINAIKDNSILDEFPEVFQGLGCLSGKYHININPLVPPVVHPPKRVPHSKREPVKKVLNRTVEAGILEKVPLNEPADWVSSLVCVDKPDGSIRVCLDPKDLNVAVKREHYS